MGNFFPNEPLSNLLNNYDIYIYIKKENGTTVRGVFSNSLNIAISVLFGYN